MVPHLTITRSVAPLDMPLGRRLSRPSSAHDVDLFLPPLVAPVNTAMTMWSADLRRTLVAYGTTVVLGPRLLPRSTSGTAQGFPSAQVHFSIIMSGQPSKASLPVGERLRVA